MSTIKERKRSTTVVFDCTAKYQGTSLNTELLLGPDLPNTLRGSTAIPSGPSSHDGRH